MDLQHAGAGPGWRHDIVTPGECRDRLAGELHRVGPVSRIVGGLTAASLSGRDSDPATGLLQELHGRKADGRPHQVDQAGDEETNAGSVGKGSGHAGGRHSGAMLRRSAKARDIGAAGPSRCVSSTRLRLGHTDLLYSMLFWKCERHVSPLARLDRPFLALADERAIRPGADILSDHAT